MKNRDNGDAAAAEAAEATTTTTTTQPSHETSEEEEPQPAAPTIAEASSPVVPQQQQQQQQPQQQQHQHSGPPPPRVIVLGAGISGLACACELQRGRGYEVLVVEARSRAGGRVKGGELKLAAAAAGGGTAAGGGGSTSPGGGERQPEEDERKPSSSSRSSSKKKKRDRSRGRGRPTKKKERQEQQQDDHSQEPNQQYIDLGGALIHGINNNPITDLNLELGIPTQPVNDLLLLDNSGWPVDPKKDDKVAQLFNDCLERSFDICRSTTSTSTSGWNTQQEQEEPKMEEQPSAAIAESQEQEQGGDHHKKKKKKPPPSSPQSQPRRRRRQRQQQQLNGNNNTTTTTTATNGGGPSQSLGVSGSSGTASAEAERGDNINDPTITSSNGGDTTAPLGSGQAAAEVAAAADATTTASEHAVGHAHLVRDQSFGDVFDQVCREKNAITPATSVLFKWHQMNLEVGCGASFPDLGTLWNEDEAYGYDGDHVATKHSWKALVDSLSQDLDILYSSPVRHVHIIEPDPTNDIAAEVEGNGNGPATSSSEPARKRAKTKKKKRIKPSVTFVPILPAGSRQRKPRRDFSSPPPPSERQSRRLRGEDATAASTRRSSRANKGQPVERYVGETKVRAGGSRKRRRDDDDGTGEASSTTSTKTNSIYIPPKPPRKTIVQITLDNGTVLEADHVVCTLPLGILKLGIKKEKDGSMFHDDDDDDDNNEDDPCKVIFDPPLPKPKQLAIQRLGAGLLNKCVLSFEYVFWQDVDFLGLAKDVTNSYLVLNAHAFTNQPVLVFLFGGTRAKELEDWTDVDIVQDCLAVLERICNTGGGRRGNNKKYYAAAGAGGTTTTMSRFTSSLPDPIDYRVTRWGNEQYSRMAFTYVPPGVDGFTELRNMSLPITKHHNNRTLLLGDGKKDAAVGVPTILFAGEHTTPYHPSTIHGAFLSGIREAYRLDCALFPHANDEITAFSDGELYERTFSLPRRFFGDDSVPVRNVPSGSAAAADAETENEEEAEWQPSSTQQQVSGEVSASATSATEAAKEETGSSSIAASRPRRQHRRRGAGTMMKLRRRGSNNNGAGAAVAVPSTENNIRRVNGRAVSAAQQQPSRRSPRAVTAAAVAASTGEAAAVASGGGDQSPNPTGVYEPEGRDLTSLENDMLIRGMESYGRYNYDYLREMILPVHHEESAGEDYWTLERVRKRCNSLKQELRKLSARGTNSWKRWVAKAVYESPSNIFLAQSDANAGAESQQQKRRPVGRPPSNRVRATTTAITQLNHQDNGDNNKKSSIAKDKRGKKSNSYVSNATYDDISKKAAKAVAFAKTKSGRLIYKPRTLSLNKKGTDGGGKDKKIAKTRSGRVIHKPPTTSP